jgi:hypothetical protein
MLGWSNDGRRRFLSLSICATVLPDCRQSVTNCRKVFSGHGRLCNPPCPHLQPAAHWLVALFMHLVDFTDKLQRLTVRTVKRRDCIRVWARRNISPSNFYCRAPACGLAAVVHNFICMTSTSGVLHDVGRLLQQRPIDSHAATRHRVELLQRGP